MANIDLANPGADEAALSGAISLLLIDSRGATLTDFGGGEDVADNAAALLAMIAAGGGSIPAGDYDLGPISVSAANWKVQCDPGAVFTRIGASGASWIIFGSGCSNCSWDGGKFDGQKSVYTALDTSLRIGSGTGRGSNVGIITPAMVTGGPSDFTLKNIEIVNAPGASLLSTGTTRLTLKNIISRDSCGTLGVAWDAGGADIDNVKIYDTNNGGRALFQHAMDVQGLFDGRVRNVDLYRQVGDTSGLSNFSSGFTAIQNRDTIFENITDHGHATTDIFTLGISCVGGDGNIYINCWSYKNRQNMEVVGESDFTIFGGGADGQYWTTTAVPSADSIQGLIIHAGSIYAGGAGTGTQGGRNGTIIGYTATRCGTSYRVRSGGHVFSACRSVGPTVDGVRLERISSIDGFENEVAPELTNISFLAGVIETSGRAGLMMDEGSSINTAGTVFRNNGQDSATYTTVQRAGFAVQGSQTKAGLYLSGASYVDDQSWTETAAISYEPGTTDASNRYTFSIARPVNVREGQRVTLKNVVSGPADATGKVIDIELDELTLEFTSAKTFIDVATAGTGTVSSSGTTLTGSGTSFTTEFVGRSWIKADGEYRKILTVTSDTVATLSSAFTSPLSGDTFQIIGADIAGVPSQQYGIVTDAYSTGVETAGATFSGNVLGRVYNGAEVLTSAAWEIVAHSGAALTVSAVTTEEELARVTLSPDILGLNGVLRIETVWAYTNSGNNKIPRVKFGAAGVALGSATSVFDPTLTTTATVSAVTEIWNANSKTSQTFRNSATGTIYGSMTQAVETSTIDTAAQMDVIFSGEKASSGETLQLRRYTISVLKVD